MENQRIFDFCVPEAQRLADLVGIRSDLFMIQTLAKAFLEYPNQPHTFQTLYRNAFCFTAIVIYGRTLGTGVRTGIPRAFIDALEPELVAAHGYFKALRDKWIAHSVNNFDQSRVTLQVMFTDSGEAIPTLVSDGHSMTTSLSASDMQRLGQLVKALLTTIKQEIEKERGTLIEHAKTIDLRGLQEDPNLFARPDTSHIYDKPMSRFDR